MSDQFICEFCNKCFSSNSNLTTHKNYCISKTAVPSHKCSFCYKCFTARQLQLSRESKCIIQ